jgi:hypothetical protein
MSASSVVHLFSIALQDGRTVEGTRDRIRTLPDAESEGLEAIRVTSEEG